MKMEKIELDYDEKADVMYISFGESYPLQDKICYNGRFLDGGQEYFIDKPEELIFLSGEKSS